MCLEFCLSYSLSRPFFSLYYSFDGDSYKLDWLNQCSRVHDHSKKMGITRKKCSSHEHEKMESPTCSKSGSSPSSGCQNSSIIRQRCNMGSDCKHGKRSAAVFPESEEELEIERWTDDEGECTWLSSDSKSSSFRFDDDGSWDAFSIDLQNLFSTMKNHNLFRSSRIFAFVNESMAYPVKGASLVLDNTLNDELNEERLFAWLLNFKGSSSTCSESIELSSENSLNENLSVLHGSDDFPNLWDQNKEFDVLQCDFPCSSIKSSNSTNNTYEADCSDPTGIPNTVLEDSTSMTVPEVANLDEYDTNGPLFWPFEHKFGSASSEFSWDFFVMSPLKSGRKAVNVEGFITPNKSLMLRLHESRKHKEKGLPSPGTTLPTPKVLEWTTRDFKNLRRTNTMPSRLSKSSQHSLRERPIEFKYEVQLEESKLLVEPSIGKLASECKEFLEGDCSTSEEISIETLIGLEEFDGHEGVDADLIEDCFSLEEFLEDNTSTCPR